jgi:hypothetical protein
LIKTIDARLMGVSTYGFDFNPLAVWQMEILRLSKGTAPSCNGWRRSQRRNKAIA